MRRALMHIFKGTCPLLMIFLAYLPLSCVKRQVDITDESVKQYLVALANIRKVDPSLIARLSSLEIGVWGSEFNFQEHYKVETAVTEAGFENLDDFGRMHTKILSALRTRPPMDALAKMDDMRARDEERLEAILSDPHTPDSVRYEIQRRRESATSAFEASRAHMKEQLEASIPPDQSNPVVEAHRAELEKALAVEVEQPDPHLKPGEQLQRERIRRGFEPPPR